MKKKILIIVVVSLLSIMVIHLAHMMFVDRYARYHFMEYKSSELPEHLEGYTIIFIADIHDYSLEQLEKNIDYLNQLDADLLLLGGDFPSGERLEKVMSLLSKIRVKDGIYGVDGNHDKANELFACMKRHGIIPLDNSGVHVQDRLYIAGVRDLWERDPNVKEALADREDGDFTILLNHNPDLVMKQDTSKVNLTLSGHTHGGEITFFGVWKPIFLTPKISRYGHRFSGGWAKTKDHTDIYVTIGLGKQFLRVFAQPEIVIITLKVE